MEAKKRNNLKSKVRNHWEKEVCGTRYGKDIDEQAVDHERMAKERYRLESYILEKGGIHLTQVTPIYCAFSQRSGSMAMATS